MKLKYYRCQTPSCEDFHVGYSVEYTDCEPEDEICGECTCKLESSDIPFDALEKDLAWRPGDDYAIRLKSIADGPLSQDMLDEMADKVDDVVREYGFKAGSWGSLRGIVHVFGRGVC